MMALNILKWCAIAAFLIFLFMFIAAPCGIVIAIIADKIFAGAATTADAVTAVCALGALFLMTTAIIAAFTRKTSA